MSKSSTTNGATVIRRTLAIAIGAMLLAAATLRAGEEDWKTLTAQAQAHLGLLNPICGAR